MNYYQIILFSATGFDFDQIRKEGRKLAKMYLDAELEEDPAKQESMLMEAEKFSAELEKKYSSADEETFEKLREVMDEEADKISKMYFDTFNDDDEDD